MRFLNTLTQPFQHIFYQSWGSNIKNLQPDVNLEHTSSSPSAKEKIITNSNYFSDTIRNISRIVGGNTSLPFFFCAAANSLKS